MKDLLTHGVLANLAGTVLERAAFVFSEIRDDPWLHGGPVWRAEVLLSIAEPEVLAVTSTPEFATLLASNLLGIELDDPVAKESSEDALREVSNMICGALVDHCQARGVVLSMGTPKLRKMERVEEHLQACREAHPLVRLLAENHCVDVALLPMSERCGAKRRRCCGGEP